MFNELIRVATILARNGYRERGGRWIAPGSHTGVAGVVLLDDGRRYSHHASDALADGHAHASFDAIRILEHAGDVREAVRSARLELGRRVGTFARA